MRSNVAIRVASHACFIWPTQSCKPELTSIFKCVRAGIAALSNTHKYVLVHDAARALATTDLAHRVLTALVQGESAVIPGLELIDTVKSIDAGGHVTACSIRVRLPRVINALGSVAPNLSPLPAAAMMAAHWLICFPNYVEM